MKWGRFFFAAAMLAMMGSIASAQALNPVFNDTGKAWIVKYDSDPQNGNKKGDVCVQIKLAAQNGSDSLFDGHVYRYDRVEPSGMNQVYKKISGAAGSVSISGETTGWNASKPRKKFTFTAAGAYVKDGEVRVVTVKGTYHAGSSVSGMDKRKDDRISVVIVDAPNTPPPPEEPEGEPTPVSTTSGEVFVSHFTLVLHPCEEEPDTEILLEEPYVEEPVYIP